MYIEGIIKNDGTITDTTDCSLWYETKDSRGYPFAILPESRVFDPDIVKWGIELEGIDLEFGVNFAHCFSWDFGHLLIDGVEAVNTDLISLITAYCNSKVEP